MTQETNTVQELILEIYQGNKKTILESLYSEIPILNMNAIIYCAHNKINTKEFVDALTDLKDSKEHILGYCISDAATAALCLVNDEPYEGENETIKKLIDVNFGKDY